MEKVTKAQVRSDFAYARHLMRLAEGIMKNKNITDFSESSEAGQIANELVASVGTFTAWLETKRQ